MGAQGGELLDGSPLRGCQVLCVLLLARRRCTLGPDHWFSSGSVAGLRRNCPEVRGHRQVLPRGLLSGSFLRFPSSGVSRGHKFPVRRARSGHKLGGRTQFGFAPQLWAGFPSAPEDCERLPSVGPCTGHCATVRDSEFQAGSDVSTRMKLPIFSA